MEASLLLVPGTLLCVGGMLCASVRAHQRRGLLYASCLPLLTQW